MTSIPSDNAVDVTTASSLFTISVICDSISSFDLIGLFDSGIVFGEENSCDDDINRSSNGNLNNWFVCNSFGDGTLDCWVCN